ncbi:ARM repeat-containing protein [Sodiomyces alkalinus F11]|uniref:ARM repeat-containing protein n=1 Tax=Sodiomyces alkalinus (strain CBS 110278 / VKM F-3762 / F11) TaxID=1314773 RepID=A0A3N2PVM7_SODAK|nr:ARM repeat-containing protein [Sodiomyces alkalinus F11]ROT38538.1 ARM repeat-containing protein [Sodiomyces alkalinus F11]
MDQKPCSARLAEFTSKRNKGQCHWGLKEIYGHVVEFCGDQHASRFLQKKLADANSEEKDQVFREVQPNIEPLSKDIYGNYVIQMLLVHGSQMQKRAIASILKGKMVEWSFNKYACRVVQKALEQILVEQRAELTQELEPNILPLIRDEFGNHVVQQVIQYVPNQHFGFIPRAVRSMVRQLSEERHACRVIQRLLEYAKAEDKEAILAEIHDAVQHLVSNEYGNYVAQHVVRYGKPADREKIISFVLGRLVALSKHKYASNVVEKCIEFGAAEDRVKIAQAFLKHGSDGTNAVPALYKDNFGNYVIQKLLKKFEDGPELDGLIAAVESISDLKKHLDAVRDPERQGNTAAADRVLEAIAKARGGSKKAAKNGHRTTTTPTFRNSRAAQVDTSASPTPVLTMEPNSPQSSNPPSTNASATGESAEEEVEQDKNGRFASGNVAPQVLEEP